MSLRDVGRMIRAAESKGPVRYITGTTTGSPDAGWIDVDIGDQIIPASAPGSLAGDLAQGQEVRLSVQGTLHTVDSVLSPVSATAVDGVPGAVSVNSTLTEGAPPGSTLEVCCTRTRGIGDDLNELREDVRDIADAVNDLRGVADQLRQALVDMGRAT